MDTLVFKCNKEPILMLFPWSAKFLPLSVFSFSSSVFFLSFSLWGSIPLPSPSHHCKVCTGLLSLLTLLYVQGVRICFSFAGIGAESLKKMKEKEEKFSHSLCNKICRAVNLQLENGVNTEKSSISLFSHIPCTPWPIFSKYSPRVTLSSNHKGEWQQKEGFKHKTMF